MDCVDPKASKAVLRADGAYLSPKVRERDNLKGASLKKNVSWYQFQSQSVDGGCKTVTVSSKKGLFEEWAYASEAQRYSEDGGYIE